MYVHLTFHASWQTKTKEVERILTPAFPGPLTSALQNSSTRGHCTKGFRWS